MQLTTKYEVGQTVRQGTIDSLQIEILRDGDIKIQYWVVDKKRPYNSDGMNWIDEIDIDPSTTRFVVGDELQTSDPTADDNVTYTVIAVDIETYNIETYDVKSSSGYVYHDQLMLSFEKIEVAQ